MVLSTFSLAETSLAFPAHSCTGDDDDMPRTGFGPVQNLSSSLVEWSCAAVITTTPHQVLPCTYVSSVTMWIQNNKQWHDTQSQDD